MLIRGNSAGRNEV